MRNKDSWFVVRWTGCAWQAVNQSLVVANFFPVEYGKARALAACLQWCRRRAGTRHPDIRFI